MITCPRCGATSHHPEDVRTGYCGRCNWWTSDPSGTLNQPWVLAEAERQGVLRPVESCSVEGHRWSVIVNGAGRPTHVVCRRCGDQVATAQP